MAVGHKFSLILSRVITEDESAGLQAECAGAAFATDTLPTNADVTVTRIDFDDTVSPSLAEAIETGLETVKKVPDLGIPGLTVPPQPTGTQSGEQTAEATGAPASGEKQAPAAAKKPAAKRSTAKAAGTKAAAARKPAAKRAASRKPATKKAATTDGTAELAGAGASS